MADKFYSSIIDAFLDDRKPNWEELDLESAVESGEEQLDRTHKYVDTDFEDEIAEGASHHTPIPAGKAANSPKRIADEKKARLDAARNLAQGKAEIKSAKESDRVGSVAGSRYAGKKDFVNDIADDVSVMIEKTYNINKAPGNAELDKKSVTDSQIKKYIVTLLEQGVPPAKIASRLVRLADNANVFNRQISYEYMNQIGTHPGMDYLEPNHYMDANPGSLERDIPISLSSSKEPLTACLDCSHFGHHIGGKDCKAGKTKMASVAPEVNSIINRLTAGVPKEQKEAALGRIAQRLLEYKQKKASKSDMYTRAADQNFSVRNIEAVRSKHEKTASTSLTVNASTIENLHKQGHSLEKIYSAATRKVGSVQAGAAVKQFVANLKKNGTKIALSQIDCRFLKQKLGVNNAIVGASKCGSCTFRQGMHCGLTGGTLLSFPGMDKASSNHKVADGAPKDGRAILAEYDLQGGFLHTAGDIDIREPERLDVSLGGSFSMGDVE